MCNFFFLKIHQSFKILKIDALKVCVINKLKYCVENLDRKKGIYFSRQLSSHEFTSKLQLIDRQALIITGASIVN